VSSPVSGLGSRRGSLALATAGIGLPSRCPSPTRNVKNWFHVDQQRLIDAFAWLSAYPANADRSRETVRSSTVRRSSGAFAARASSSAMARRSLA